MMVNKMKDRNSEIKYDGDKTKRKKGKFFLGLVVAVIAIGAVMMSPIFTIKEVVVSDTDRYTSQEICDLANVNVGMNIFTVSKNKVTKLLKTSHYIQDVEVVKEFPNKIKLNVMERKVRGYVPYMNSYLYIDENGRVLEIKDYFTDPLPVVKGLEFESFQLGETIDAVNKDALYVVVIISQVMIKYEMLDLVVNLDVSNTENITARVNKVDINLGTISNCDEKIRTMAAIMKEIPEEDRGTLDLSDLSKPLVFKYLT